MDKNKKTLNKSNKANMLNTFYDLNGNYGAYSPCSCSCTDSYNGQTRFFSHSTIEASYRDAIGVTY